jgi:hypothetical protein
MVLFTSLDAPQIPPPPTGAVPLEPSAVLPETVLFTKVKLPRMPPPLPVEAVFPEIVLL